MTQAEEGRNSSGGRVSCHHAFVFLWCSASHGGTGVPSPIGDLVVLSCYVDSKHVAQRAHRSAQHHVMCICCGPMRLSLGCGAEVHTCSVVHCIHMCFHKPQGPCAISRGCAWIHCMQIYFTVLNDMVLCGVVS